MDLIESVEHKNGGIYKIAQVVLYGSRNKNSFPVSLDAFNEDYEEYVDPKDLEIARLLKIIEDLEKPKGRYKPRRHHLNIGKIFEVKELYEKGVFVKEIATEYGVSNSTIYKWAKELDWEINNPHGVSNSLHNHLWAKELHWEINNPQ